MKFRRFLSLTVISLLMAIAFNSSFVSATSDTSGYSTKAKVNTGSSSSLRVRSSPGILPNNIIGMLSANSDISITSGSEKNGFVQAKGINATNKKVIAGWVSKQYVSILPAKPISIPKNNEVAKITKKFTFSGTVKNFDKNIYLKDVSVKLGNKTIKTDSNGKFSFANTLEQKYTLSISKSGYRTYTSTINLNANTNNLYYLVVSSVSKKAPVVLQPKKQLVVIDAGHGGSDPGAVSGNVQEKDLNLDISTRLSKLLNSNGVETKLIRTTDKTVSLAERTNIANSLNASLFVCIHNNAFSASANGTETLYNPSKNYGVGLSGYQFASIIQKSLVKSLGLYDRGLSPRTDLYVLNTAKMPAILPEIGFITNSYDRQKLTTPQFRQTVASALCSGILTSLNYLK